MSDYSRRRLFSAKEDATLVRLVKEIGNGSWTKIAKRMPKRTAKQCRDRYNNYLKEGVKTTKWTPEEDKLLNELYEKLGPKWVQMSKLIEGRSENDIKNRWYKHILPGKNNVEKEIIFNHEETEVLKTDETESDEEFQELFRLYLTKTENVAYE